MSTPAYIDSAETEVVRMCLPHVLMNIQHCYPSYSNAELAGGGKTKGVLPNQGAGSINFLRNKPMMLEKFS